MNPAGAVREPAGLGCILNNPVARRKNIRLKDYDYTQPGAYFVTICTHHRLCIFGEAVQGEIKLNEGGHIVQACWNWVFDQYPYVDQDVSVIMPNHFHAVISITECRGGSRTAPTKIKNLGSLIGAFKTVSTKQINEKRNTPGLQVWQRNYYEHIIRNESI